MEHEENFLYNAIINDNDFKSAYQNYFINCDYAWRIFQNIKDITFNTTIKNLVEYVLNSDFNPYLDKEYLDISYVKDTSTNKIYNMDDIYEEFIGTLKSSESEK